jgi:hypothetical protein
MMYQHSHVQAHRKIMNQIQQRIVAIKSTTGTTTPTPKKNMVVNIDPPPTSNNSNIHHDNNNGITNTQYSYQSNKWNIDLTMKELQRLRPGFIRVEVLEDSSSSNSNESKRDDRAFQEKKGLVRGGSGAADRSSKEEEEEEYHHNTNFRGSLHPNQSPINISTGMDGMDSRVGIDPAACCCTIPSHITAKAISKTNPSSKDIVIWETSIIGFQLRPWRPIVGKKNPIPPDGLSVKKDDDVDDDKDDHDDGNWVAATLAGARNFPALWAGQYLDPIPIKPNRGHPKSMAQSAGWMGSPREVMEYHTTLCQQGFLPPLDGPTFLRDGLWRHNVEFYSGGIQLWGKLCEVQRIYSVRTYWDFAQHLVYHTSNNKQHSIVPSSRILRANALWKELELVKNRIEKEHWERINGTERVKEKQRETGIGA